MLGEEGFQRIIRVGLTLLARLVEIQIWHLPAGSVGEGLSKRTMDFANSSVWEKTVPPALVLRPDNSGPHHVCLTPFKVLPQC